MSDKRPGLDFGTRETREFWEGEPQEPRLITVEEVGGDDLEEARRIVELVNGPFQTEASKSDRLKKPRIARQKPVVRSKAKANTKAAKVPPAVKS